MQIQRIRSEEDVRIAQYRKLPEKSQRSSTGPFIVEGRFLVERLVASNFGVESILVDAEHVHFVPTALPDEVPIFAAASSVLDQIAGFHFHRGILACGQRKPRKILEEVREHLESIETLVICAGVQDPVNLGGILRNAMAFGVDTVIMAPPCADPLSRRVSRVSMGAVLKLHLVHSTDLATDLVMLRDEYRFELVAAVLDSQAESLERTTRSRRSALLFGNEGFGLQHEFLNLCTRKITIPMCHDTDSLNAAVASGVFLYHFMRIVS